MRSARPLIGSVLALVLLAFGAASQAVDPSRSAPVATGERTEAPTTPPPGSRERRAILDALRAELSHLIGPDLVFVVATLRVREGWAWIEAAPQSRDGANRYEDVTALLRKEDGRWVVQLLGPCGEAQDPESGCNEDIDPEPLMARFPTLPPDLVPHEVAPPANAVLEDARGATADGCRPPCLVRSRDRMLECQCRQGRCVPSDEAFW
jgi:hypothetical protein